MTLVIKKTTKGNVQIALPVSAGLESGDIAALGTSGLLGLMHTNRATTATIAAGTAAQGLANTEATVELLGIATTARLSIAAAISQFAKVYRALDNDGVATYTPVATGNTFVGYALETLSGAGVAEVALVGRAGGVIVANLFQATPADAEFWIAPAACRLVGIQYNHGTAGSDGGAVVAMPRRCQGTEAPTAGDALISDNTDAGFNCKSTANTVQTGTLITTAATLAFDKGDRLSLDYTGTLTSLANVALTAIFELI